MALSRKIRPTLFPTPLIVLGVGVIASVFVTLQISRAIVAKDQERFEHAVSQAQDGIAGRLETYIAMLRAGAGLVASQSGVVDRIDFRLFVQQLKLSTQYPGVQGIGFSARLPGQDVDAAEQALAAYGAPEIKLYPPGRRDEIHAIIHLEPLDRRNQAALGYDMFSEPIRRAAMERARDTGLPAASGRVQLVQEIDGAVQSGFLIYVPVYRGGATPASIAERRVRLQGFVYSAFRADDLMRGIFGTVERPRVHLEIYDGEASAASLLYSTSIRPPDSPRFSAARTTAVAGRSWTINYSTRPEFEFSSSQSFVPFVLLGGLFATFLLAALTWSQARAKRSAEETATALHANARKLEVLHATATRLSGELDTDRLVQDVTDAGRELAGAEIGAFFYNKVDDGGESYVLFALSGAPREAFARMGMPRNTAIFGPTFRGEGTLRADDITADPRFGRNEPFMGFPPGHWPVRSYLAVPVVSSSGKVLGGLFFGHSQIGEFTEQSERSIAALAGHAAIAIDNSRLFKASQEEIAARKKIEEHQQLLLDELNHRVKNTLVTVQSIASQTLRTAPDPEAFNQAFEARLIALSEAHNLLSRANWRGVVLHDLVSRELAPHGVGADSRIEISGESIWLPPQTAVAIGMAIHELATNAARHGSLSTPEGRVNVSWTIARTDAGQGLKLVWQESNGPAVKEPQRRGFGSRMIERGLKHDLQGEAKLHFEHTGLRCVIEAVLPVESVAA